LFTKYAKFSKTRTRLLTINIPIVDYCNYLYAALRALQAATALPSAARAVIRHLKDQWRKGILDGLRCA